MSTERLLVADGQGVSPIDLRCWARCRPKNAEAPAFYRLKGIDLVDSCLTLRLGCFSKKCLHAQREGSYKLNLRNPAEADDLLGYVRERQGKEASLELWEVLARRSEGIVQLCFTEAPKRRQIYVVRLGLSRDMSGTQRKTLIPPSNLVVAGEGRDASRVGSYRY